MTLEFLITSMIVILLPGTGVLYTMAIGLGRGFLPSIAAAFGCTLGIVPAAVASILGLAALLHASALAFMVVKYLGVAYLFYMAWSIIRAGGAMAFEEDTQPRSFLKIAISGMLINVLNPKLSLFFLAFLPQFLPVSAASSTWALVTLAAVFMALTFLVFVIYGALAALVRDYIISRPKVLRRIQLGFGGAFGLMGAKLAFSER